MISADANELSSFFGAHRCYTAHEGGPSLVPWSYPGGDSGVRSNPPRSLLHARVPLEFHQLGSPRSGGSRIDCKGGLSIPRALARAKFYVLRPLLDRLRMTYVLPVRPTRKLASLAIIIIITSRMQASGERSPALHRRPRTCKPNH